MPSQQFNTLKAIPDLSGKVILITGGTSGVGAETVKQLAVHNPSKIFFTGRNTKAANTLIESTKLLNPHVQVRFVPCDLSDLSSVRQASNRIAAKATRIDLFFCNAGVMALSPSLSKDGYEQQFATNHLGHALLIDLLMPVLQDTASLPGSDVRIIITSSQAATMGLTPKGGINFRALRTEQKMFGGRWLRYGQSKLANILYAKALQKQYPCITTVSIHPGIGYTGLQGNLKLFDRFIMWITTIGKRSSVEQLSWNGLWAATAPKGVAKGQVQGGEYYEPVGIKPRAIDYQTNTALEDELWDWTQEELEAWELKAGLKVRHSFSSSS
ncbi:oxidoreductase [Aureobasidium pullulans]|uniref:Oxidoreductase n=1 Tax=Aureobasidium pullulans TaxID=5580 RepID=A0A4S9NNG6_AURPU|nr:oxidoreductase [Aureobasidium pullulans]THY57115.1 oxidoreductase [Aureobasidium pullulans]THY95341.1 oxidoreductase [Aureobasidium pullulans]